MHWKRPSGERVVAKVANAATDLSSTHDDAVNPITESTASLTFCNIPRIRQHLISAGKWIRFH
jgi:hypothetical protein